MGVCMKDTIIVVLVVWFNISFHIHSPPKYSNSYAVILFIHDEKKEALVT